MFKEYLIFVLWNKCEEMRIGSSSLDDILHIKECSYWSITIIFSTNSILVVDRSITHFEKKLSLLIWSTKYVIYAIKIVSLDLYSKKINDIIFAIYIVYLLTKLVVKVLLGMHNTPINRCGGSRLHFACAGNICLDHGPMFN
jgi:hypothetical protein